MNLDGLAEPRLIQGWRRAGPPEAQARASLGPAHGAKRERRWGGERFIERHGWGNRGLSYSRDGMYRQSRLKE